MFKLVKKDEKSIPSVHPNNNKICLPTDCRQSSRVGLKCAVDGDLHGLVGCDVGGGYFHYRRICKIHILIIGSGVWRK